MDVCTGVGTGIGTTSIPVPDNSESSVKHNPVPGTSVRSVRHQNPVPPHCDMKIRLILMRSNSELQIFTSRCDEWIGLTIMHSDIAKSDGIKSDLRLRLPKSDFGPKLDDSVHRILKSIWHRSFYRVKT